MPSRLLVFRLKGLTSSITAGRAGAVTNLNAACLTEVSLSVIGAVYNVTTDSRNNLTGCAAVCVIHIKFLQN